MIRDLMYAVAVKDAAWPILPIVVADTETGEIVYLSAHAASTFGYTVEELLGQSIEKLVPQELASQHATWRRDAATPKTRLMGLGRKIQGRRKDGSLFPVHVGLTSVCVQERMLGVAFIVDLTGIMLEERLLPAGGAS